MIPPWSLFDTESESKKNTKRIKYRIWMEETAQGLNDAGWYCGSGARYNGMLHRTLHKSDADTFETFKEAKQVVKYYRKLGYDCEVRPKKSDKEKEREEFELYQKLKSKFEG